LARTLGRLKALLGPKKAPSMLTLRKYIKASSTSVDTTANDELDNPTMEDDTDVTDILTQISPEPVPTSRTSPQPSTSHGVIPCPFQSQYPTIDDPTLLDDPTSPPVPTTKIIRTPRQLTTNYKRRYVFAPRHSSFQRNKKIYVEQDLTDYPNLSTTARANKFHVGKRTMERTMTDIRNNVEEAFPPLTRRMVHEETALKAFARKLTAMSQTSPRLYTSLLFTDEKVFPLRKGVVRTVGVNSVNVWCAMCSVRVIGPFFIERSGQAAVLNAKLYAGILSHFLLPELNR